MKKFLKAIVAWLDRKFPDKVEVTLVEYLTLKAQIDVVGNLIKQHDTWAEKTDGRMREIEQQIANLNVANGLNGLADKFKKTAFVR